MSDTVTLNCDNCGEAIEIGADEIEESDGPILCRKCELYEREQDLKETIATGN